MNGQWGEEKNRTGNEREEKTVRLAGRTANQQPMK